MQELKNTLDASLQRIEPSQVATARLPVVREHLTDYVNAVHSAYGMLGISPYVGFDEFDAVRSANKFLYQGDITEVTRTGFDDVLRDLSDLVTAAEPVGSPNDHAWRGAHKTFYSESDLDAISQIGEQILAKVTSLSSQGDTLENRLGLPKLRTFADFEIACEIAATIARSPGAPHAGIGE